MAAVQPAMPPPMTIVSCMRPRLLPEKLLRLDRLFRMDYPVNIILKAYGENIQAMRSSAMIPLLFVVSLSLLLTCGCARKSLRALSPRGAASPPKVVAYL